MTEVAARPTAPPPDVDIDEQEGMVKSRSWGRQTWDRFRRHKIAMTAAVVLVVIVIAFFFGPMLSSWGFEEIDFDSFLGEGRAGPSAEHWFGTDDIGRDLMVRTFTGGRFSLFIALMVALITTAIGTLVGSVAAFFAGTQVRWYSVLGGTLVGLAAVAVLGSPWLSLAWSTIGLLVVVGAALWGLGWLLAYLPKRVAMGMTGLFGVLGVVMIIGSVVLITTGNEIAGWDDTWFLLGIGSLLIASGPWEIDVDLLLSQLTNLFLIVPALIILLVVGIKWGSTPVGIALLLAVLLWPQISRIVRGLVLQFREQEFVMAAQAAGASPLRIMFRHIIPNVFGPIVVNATLLISVAIILESTLSFLALGVQPPTPTLGTLVNDAKGAIDSDPRFILIPGGFIVLIALCINFLGDGLRDALDPTTRRGRE